MTTEEALDQEIADLQARIVTLEAHRANFAAILLSQPHLSARLEQRPVKNEPNVLKAIKAVKNQVERNVENAYRICAGVTAYKVKDPDPYAVDNGNLLGVRIEVPIDGRFIEVYNVLLNRPEAMHKNMLKIHAHTIPTCIPLQSLADKWLPRTRSGAEKTTEQNLIKFGKALRKELVSWHLRMSALKKLQAEARVGDGTARQKRERPATSIGQVLNAFVTDDEESEEDDISESSTEAKIMNIEANPSVREIRIEWSNGRMGVMQVTKDGEVEKATVREPDGSREPSLTRKAIGRIEGLIQRLSE